MDRRQLLAELAGGFTLGLGWWRRDDSDGTAAASPAAGAGTRSPTTSSSSAAPPAGGAAGSAIIDPTNLATYTSDTPSYTIKYPAPWRVTVSKPKAVRFIAPARPGRMFIRVKHGVPSTVPRKMIIATAIRKAKRTYSLNRVTRVGQRSTTLPHGIPATVINARVRRSSSTMVLRGTFLVAHVTDSVYGIGILVPDRAHTPPVKRAMQTIVTSLTLGRSPSARQT